MATKKTDDEKLVIAVARVMCKVEGEYEWKYLKDTKGNPSTAWKYYDYIKIAQAVIKEMRKTKIRNS